MQLSGGEKKDRQAYIIYFTDARHAALVSTHQHSKGLMFCTLPVVFGMKP